MVTILVRAGQNNIPPHLLQEGGPFPRSETRLLSNIQKRIIQGDIHADKAGDFIGKRSPDAEQLGKGIQDNCSVTRLAVLAFMVMGLVSGLSLANYSDSGSFLGGTCITQPRWILPKRPVGSLALVSITSL